MMARRTQAGLQPRLEPKRRRALRSPGPGSVLRHPLKRDQGLIKDRGRRPGAAFIVLSNKSFAYSHYGGEAVSSLRPHWHGEDLNRLNILDGLTPNRGDSPG